MNIRNRQFCSGYMQALRACKGTGCGYSSIYMLGCCGNYYAQLPCIFHLTRSREDTCEHRSSPLKRPPFPPFQMRLADAIGVPIIIIHKLRRQHHPFPPTPMKLPVHGWLHHVYMASTEWGVGNMQGGSLLTLSLHCNHNLPKVDSVSTTTQIGHKHNQVSTVSMPTCAMRHAPCAMRDHA